MKPALLGHKTDPETDRAIKLANKIIAGVSDRSLTHVGLTILLLKYRLNVLAEKLQRRTKRKE